MRISPYNRSLVPITLFFVSFWTCTNLLASEIPEFDKNKFRQRFDGLAVSIQPFTKKEDVEKHFGGNLLSYGILPMIVYAENQNPDLSYILLKNEATLTLGSLPPDHRPIQENQNSARTANLLSTGALVSSVGMIGYGPIALVALPLKLIGDKMANDAAEVSYNLILHELQSRAVAPGKNVLGFIYFTLPEQKNSTENWLLRFKAINGQTKTRLDFEIPFELKRDGA